MSRVCIKKSGLIDVRQTNSTGRNNNCIVYGLLFTDTCLLILTWFCGKCAFYQHGLSVYIFYIWTHGGVLIYTQDISSLENELPGDQYERCSKGPAVLSILFPLHLLTLQLSWHTPTSVAVTSRDRSHSQFYTNITAVFGLFIVRTSLIDVASTPSMLWQFIWVKLRYIKQHCAIICVQFSANFLICR